ncbi:T-cell surface protein tactile [Pyxicephalus adspersus]|uniref:T-cell surface protein tactile n=1 Tax=Pyxicephalus adspersus TaxID=30357 RepID=UPI003B5B377B
MKFKQYRSLNAFYASFIILIAITSCREPEKKYLPLGADITLGCHSSMAGKPSFSGSFERRKNMKEFVYNDTVYIQIFDFSENNRGIYRCVSQNNIISVTSLELNKRSSGEELVKFRLVGNDMLMYCKRLTKATSLQWKWISSDSQSTATITLENNKIISEQNFQTRLKFSPDFALKLSPVTFEDAGKYQCHFSDHIGKTIHLITIKVTAYPSTEDFHGYPMVLTCSLSHPLPKNNIVFVWTKSTAMGSVPVKTDILKNEETNSSMLVEGDPTESINWTCIVFYEGTLVAFVPIELWYKYNTYEPTTDLFKTSALIPSAGEEKTDENSQLNVVYFVRTVCLAPAFAASVLIVCRTFKQKYLPGA